MSRLAKTCIGTMGSLRHMTLRGFRRPIISIPIGRSLISITRASAWAVTLDSQTHSSSFSTSRQVSKAYYDMFPKTLKQGPPPGGPFDIDTRELRREFLQLQAATHPDKAHHNEDLRKEYELRSAQLNTAYTTLTNILLRSQYLLKAQGIDALSERDSLVDDELLMDVLTAREALADANSEQDLEPLSQENIERIAATEQALTEAFDNQDLQRAKEETIRLSYWYNIRNQIKERTGTFE